MGLGQYFNLCKFGFLIGFHLHFCSTDVFADHSAEKFKQRILASPRTALVQLSRMTIQDVKEREALAAMLADLAPRILGPDASHDASPKDSPKDSNDDYYVQEFSQAFLSLLVFEEIKVIESEHAFASSNSKNVPELKNKTELTVLWELLRALDSSDWAWGDVRRVLDGCPSLTPGLQVSKFYKKTRQQFKREETKTAVVYFLRGQMIPLVSLKTDLWNEVFDPTHSIELRRQAVLALERTFLFPEDYQRLSELLVASNQTGLTDAVLELIAAKGRSARLTIPAVLKVSLENSRLAAKALGEISSLQDENVKTELLSIFFEDTDRDAQIEAGRALLRIGEGHHQRTDVDDVQSLAEFEKHSNLEVRRAMVLVSLSEFSQRSICPRRLEAPRHLLQSVAKDLPETMSELSQLLSLQTKNKINPHLILVLGSLAEDASIRKSVVEALTQSTDSSLSLDFLSHSGTMAKPLIPSLIRVAGSSDTTDARRAASALELLRDHFSPEDRQEIADLCQKEIDWFARQSLIRTRQEKQEKTNLWEEIRKIQWFARGL